MMTTAAAYAATTKVHLNTLHHISIDVYIRVCPRLRPCLSISMSMSTISDSVSMSTSLPLPPASPSPHPSTYAATLDAEPGGSWASRRACTTSARRRARPAIRAGQTNQPGGDGERADQGRGNARRCGSRQTRLAPLGQRSLPWESGACIPERAPVPRSKTRGVLGLDASGSSFWRGELPPDGGRSPDLWARGSSTARGLAARTGGERAAAPGSGALRPGGHGCHQVHRGRRQGRRDGFGLWRAVPSRRQSSVEAEQDEQHDRQRSVSVIILCTKSRG